MSSEPVAGSGQPVLESPAGSRRATGAGTAARSSGWKFEVAWLGVLGTGIFIALRLPYAAYYERLGVSPEEVGLDYATLLAQSSLLLVFVALMAALPIMMFLIGWVVLDAISLVPGVMEASAQAFRNAQADNRVDRLGNGKIRKKLSAIYPDPAWVGKQLSMLRILYGVRNSSGKRMVFRFFGLSMQILISLITGASRRLLRPVLHAFLWLVAVSFFGLLVGFLPVVARDAAAAVKACEPPPNGIFKLNADPVRIYASADLKPVFADKQLVLFGDSSSTYVMYDCHANEALRLPMGSVAITSIARD